MKASPSRGAGYLRHPTWISIAVSALMLAVLGAAELAARKYAPVPVIQDYEQFLFDSSGPFFRPKIVHGKQWLIQVPGHSFFASRQRFALEKPAGQRRIVVIGESSAMFLGRSLSALAARNKLSPRIEIINMAVGASDFEQTMRRFHEALQYAPDTIVLLFGHNLFYRIPMVEPSSCPGVDGLRFLLLKSRLLSSLVRYRRSCLPAVALQTPGRWLAFRESLSKMADAAQRQGVRLALCTAPGNLHFPPLAKEPALWAPEFLEAKYLYWTGQRESAIRKCRLLLSRKPEAWWDFQLGEWLYQAGRYAQARGRLVAARDEDAERRRASSAINGLIRDVAGRKRLVLLDFERLVSKSAPHGIPGWEDFADDQHVLGFDIDLEAADCLRALGGLRESPPSPKAVGEWKTTPRAQILLDMSRKFPLGQEALKTAYIHMALAYLPELLSGGEEDIRALRRRRAEKALLLSCIGDAYWRAGLRARAMRLNDEARQLAPQESEFCLQRAMFHLNSGEKPEAARWLRLTLKLRPDQGEARFYLSRLEAEGSA